MGKFDLDTLLTDLGLSRAKPGPASADAPLTTPSPSIPLNQASGPTDPVAATPASHDPAPPHPPAPAPKISSSDSPNLHSSPPPSHHPPAPPSTQQMLDDVLLDTDEILSLVWGPDAASSSASPSTALAPENLGRVLVERQVVTAEQLANAQTVLRQSPGRSLKTTLVEMGVDEEAVQRVVAELNQLPFERIDLAGGYHPTLLQRLGVEYCKANRVMPLRREESRIVVGTAEPGDVFVLDEIRRRLGGAPIRHILVTEADIEHVLEAQAEGDTEVVDIDEILADIDEGDVEVVQSKDEDADFERQAGESPVIRYVNFIIQTATKEGASDIHIEPGDKRLKVRFRIDGILFDMMSPPHKMHAAIISRLKIMANLDISERRLPQDGRIRAVVAGRKLDLRISTLPTVAGEKCVMRLLDNRSIAVGLNELGLSDDALSIWKRQIDAPHGILLVTGPTGSGKTTTLYSSLRQMDTSRLNISTVEDPVEYHLEHISQVQTHEKIGLSFANCLRSLLRQDPDVIMVGEIRDSDTARIAIQAALTGHLVLSTLHTNDAPASITRLINIGVEPFLIGAALNAVLAQRLVRRICSACQVAEEPSAETAEFLTMQGYTAGKIFKGTGCDKCRQSGYSGRVGIYELLVLDDVTRDSIARSPNVTEFRRMCIERGMVTLRQDGMLKVAKGQTTIEEVMRVTESTI